MQMVQRRRREAALASSAHGRDSLNDIRRTWQPVRPSAPAQLQSGLTDRGVFNNCAGAAHRRFALAGGHLADLGDPPH